MGRGRFITRAQIDSMAMPGITAQMEVYGVPMLSNRRGEKWPTGTGRCRMRVFIHDVPAEGFVIDELVRPDNIEGVEIYRSAYEAPPRYSSRMNTCGVVLIWTRMDRAPGLAVERAAGRRRRHWSSPCHSFGLGEVSLSICAHLCSCRAASARVQSSQHTH